MRKSLHHILVLLGGAGLTLLFFFVLPLIQAISQDKEKKLTVRATETVSIPPPPPIEEVEPEPEPEPEEEPPVMDDEIQPLDLSQLELALNPGGFAGGWMNASLEIKLTSSKSGGEAADALFSLGDLDQRPRVIYQPGPVIDDKVRRKAPGKVALLFVVNKKGRVENAIVQNATDAVFVGPALAAIRKWKFEPGKRCGKPVKFRMRVPISFPKGL